MDTNPSASPYPLVDIALSRRLERAEAHANRRFVESRARVQPDVGACWIEAGGAYAMFDGVGSPISQTFGLGVFEPMTPEILATLEHFFTTRGSDTFHEVSPLVDPSALALLSDRGYRPCELTSVLFQPLPLRDTQANDSAARTAPAITVSPVTVAERRIWADTAYQGWQEFEAVREFLAAFGPTAVGAEDAQPFLAFAGSQPIAAASMSMHDGVAILAGASTIPEARGRGAQSALLRARLAHAAASGCSVAMMGALPGSGSQRNAERNGFRIAYTRIKWHRPVGGSVPSGA